MHLFHEWNSRKKQLLVVKAIDRMIDFLAVMENKRLV